MNFTDTHTHLYVDDFSADRAEVVKRAIDAGITRMVLPGIKAAYVPAQLDLCEKFPNNCFAAFGLHPSDVKEDFETELEIVEKYIGQGAAVAVGEIGIDLYWDKTFAAEQKIAFERQVRLAKMNSLPIIIHVREAFDEVFEIIDKLNDKQLSGIFHSFTGTPAQAQKIIEYGGFKIGINGIVSFKNAGLDKTVKNIDLENIVLETDSPYLAPVPKRGKRNESAFLMYVAEKIADIKKVSLEHLADITNKNAESVFKQFNNC